MKLQKIRLWDTKRTIREAPRPEGDGRSPQWKAEGLRERPERKVERRVERTQPHSTAFLPLPWGNRFWYGRRVDEGSDVRRSATRHETLISFFCPFSLLMHDRMNGKPLSLIVTTIDVTKIESNDSKIPYRTDILLSQNYFKEIWQMEMEENWK